MLLNTLTVRRTPWSLYTSSDHETLPGHLVTEGFGERETHPAVVVFFVCVVFVLLFLFFLFFFRHWGFGPNCDLKYSSEHKAFSFSCQSSAGRLPRQSTMINTALAGVVQCFGQWGVHLCHLILLVMPRLEDRDRNKKTEKVVREMHVRENK